MQEIQIHDKTFVRYVPQEQIRRATQEVAERIRREVLPEDPLFVCIMNGAFMFASELLQLLPGDQEIAFARYSSYEGLHSSYVLKEVMPVTVPLTGRTVVIVEDLIDTGYTMECLLKRFAELGARRVLIAAMLMKKGALQCAIAPDYIGLEIENKFIVGHGLDYDGRGRSLPDIYILKE